MVSFNQIKRLERWIRVEKAVIKFLCRAQGFGKARIDSLFEACDVRPYESLQQVDNPLKEYELFRSTFLSKSHVLNQIDFSYGLDSVSLVSTANSLLIKGWNETMIRAIGEAKDLLRRISLEHLNLVQIGRTHGAFGEPTSFGYRFAMMYSDLDRYSKALYSMRSNLEVVVINYESLLDPSMGPDLHRFLSEELGLFMGSGNVPGPLRGCHLSLLTMVNGLAKTISKHVLDLSLMSENEVGEIETNNHIKQRMISLEMEVRTVDENVQSYQDLWSTLYGEGYHCLKHGEERLYGALRGAMAIVRLFMEILRGVSPNHKSLEQNLDRSGEIIYSQRILLHLISNERGDADRVKLAEHVQELCRLSRENSDLKFLLKSSAYGRKLPMEELEKLFERETFLVNVRAILTRIFRYEIKTKSLKKVLWGENELKYLIEALADRLNRHYEGATSPVTVITFAERSLVFAGNLLMKLRFPLSLLVIPHNREKRTIGKIECDRALIQGKRLLIVDFLIHKESRLDHFIEKISEVGSPLDVKICSLLRFNDVTDERFVVNWSAIECPADDFYAGFGKTCGSSDSLRQLPMIGLAA